MSILNQLPQTLLLLLLTSSLHPNLLNLNLNLVVEGKEIIATNEWQLLQEDDTIPAGLHIRMDFESGQKWVKLDTDADDSNSAVEVVDVMVPKSDGESSSSVIVNAGGDHSNDNTNNSNKKDGIKITHLKSTTITPEQSTKITNQLLEQDRLTTASLQRSRAKASIAALNDYPAGDIETGLTDIDMMVRALGKLPTAEIERMGGIPVRPATTLKSTNESSVAKGEWEGAIRELWDRRQAELKQMEEEYLADAPDLLRERIKSLTEYLGDPVVQLQRYLDEEEEKSTNADDGNSDEEEEEEEKGDVVWVVDDLEYQLMDIDMARDFHTMGGWPFLVSLLTDSIHGVETTVVQDDNTHTSTSTLNDSSNNNTITATKRRMILQNEQQKQTVQTLIWKIQGLACSAIGSAVRNIEEFHPWALEDFEVDGYTGDDERSVTNVLSILVSNIDSYTNTDLTTTTLQPEKWQTNNGFLKKIYRELHALGALLRGNRMAIDAFASVVLDGPRSLRRMIDSILHHHMEEEEWKMGVYTERLIVRTVRLAVDIVMDVVLHPRTTDGDDPQSQQEELSQLQKIDQKTIESFTTKEWCAIPLDILEIPSTAGSSSSSSIDRMKREMLSAAVGMAPYCSYEWSDFDINSIALSFDLEVDSEEDREEERKELEDLWNQLYEIVVR